MPFKEDRRSQRSAQWIATLVCATIVGVFLFAGLRQQKSISDAPPEMRLPPHRPAMNSAATKPTPSRPEPFVRVNLTVTPQSQVRVAVRGPYVVTPIAREEELSTGTSLAQTTVTSVANGLKFGGKMIGESAVEIRPLQGDLVSLNDHAYHGVLRISRQKSGKLIAVNVLPLEQYISCVLDAEMPAKFPVAARQAQAIVARTYALWQMQQANPAAEYDVFATVRSQNYLGVEYVDRRGRRLAGESSSSREAVAATRGKVCRVEGRLFCTYYSAVCGGTTTPGKELFSDADATLRSVRCDWCRESDKYRWTTEISSADLLQVLRKQSQGKHLTGIHSIRQIRGPAAGEISEWNISDGRRTVTVNGVTLRQNFPAGKLFSPHFSMRMSQGTILVEGQGHGHGAGFCQWGARGLAQAGKSATEIVEYYYPGATVIDNGY